VDQYWGDHGGAGVTADQDKRLLKITLRIYLQFGIYSSSKVDKFIHADE
jgi:hypothetical protein